MVFSLFYLAVNITCLTILLRGRYHRLWLWCCIAQAAVIAEALVELAVPATASWGNRYVWFPVDAALLIALLGAIVEALWTSLATLHHRRLWRGVTCGGIVVFLVMQALSLAPEASGDWYQQFCAGRRYGFLGLAFVALFTLAIGAALLIRWPRVGRIGWPRMARLQAALYAIWMGGRVLLVNGQDWHLNWSHFDITSKWLEMVVAMGFLINSRLLRAELIEAGVDLPIGRSAPRDGRIGYRYGQHVLQGD